MKKTTRIFSILLIAAMLLGALALTASAAPATKQYDVNGDGTKENAYEIKTADDLLWFAQQVNGGNKGIHGVLMNDIDMSTVCSATIGNWTPIGNQTNSFGGYFDGRGFTVKNLYFDDENASSVGLFGEASKQSLIRNVTVTGTIRAKQVIGAIVGMGRGTVRNCVNYANMHATERDVGGIVGHSSCSIYGCINYGNISAETYYAGGIIGFGYDNTVQDCLNVGKISGRNSYGLGHMNQASCNLSNFLNLGSADTDGVSDKGVTNCYSVSETSVSGATQIASGDACVTSGELAFLLGGTWGQEIGKDATPIPGGMKVYKTMDPATLCTDTEITYMYANSENTKKSHDTNMPAETYENGFCPNCGDYQPAVLNGDTYEIFNAGQLYWFAQHVNAGNRYANARLMANITVNQNVLTASGDLNGDPASFRAWIPIASISEYFGGTFHGDGYTVSGLYAKAYGVGFFEQITNGGKVYNLGILDSYFENTGYASGAIAGYLGGSGITVENCFSNATIAGNSYISGGLLGSANSYATVKNCFYFGKTVGDPFVYSGFNLNQDKSGNNYYVSTKDDGRPETTAISAEILASGELAYLLNGSVSGATTWGQVIGTDAYPTLMAGEGEKVYRITLCDGTQGYSNEEKITQHDPSVIAADRFTADGKCLACGTQAAARLTDGENVTYYQNIDHALTAAQATTGATVKLLTDVILGNVEIRGTFTLDLNGFTLKSMDNFNYAIMLRGGHLTITDTSAAQTGTVLKNAKDRDAISVSGASLTINAGTYGEVSGNGEDTYITINGGNFGSAEMNTGNLTVKAGQFAVLWYAPTNLEECMAEDSYVYDSNNELVDGRQIRRIENVTVRQGADLKYAEMTLEYTETAYTALEKRPTVALTINGRAVAASNYDVAYSNNMTVGTEATVTVTGKGSYSGSNSTTFEITKGALQVVMNPETTYEFGAIYTDVVNKGEVVIVGNESAIITGTWTWVEAGNTALFTPDAQYEGLFEELTHVSVTHVVTAATPVIEVVTPAPSMGPGQRIRMSVVVKNPHDGELTDLPTAFRLTYKIGENGTPVTVDGLEFTLPADTLLGEKVYVTVENVAVSGKYVATTSVNTIELLVGQVDYSTQIKALEEQIAQLKATHGADVTALEEELAALKAAVAALNDTYATDEELAKAVENLNETIAALNQRITNLENTYATKTALENAIKALEEAIAAGDAAGTKALEEAVAALNKALEEAVAALNKALEEAVAALEKAYKDADDALKSNLETLINTTKTTLEQAIAALDARVGQNEADIADLQEALEEAIRNLEAAIAAGDEANAEALKKAVEELTELLNKAVAALEKADETNRTELETLINQAKTTLEQAIAALDARVAQNEADIALLQASLEAAIRNLEAAIAAGDEANAKALEEAVNLLTQMLNEAVAALEKADETNRTALEALIQTAKETLEAAIAQLRQDLENAVEELENADQANAEALAEAVKNLTAAIEAAEAAAAAEDAAIRAELAEAKAALELSISRLRGELYTIRNDLTTSMKAGDAALDQKITQLASALEAAVAALEAADQAQKAELTAAIEAAKATLNAAIEKVAIDLADAYETLRLSLANGDKALHARIDTLTAALNAAIAASEAADEAMRTELHTRISQAEAALNSAILQLQNNLEATKAALNAKDEQLNTMVIVAIVLGGLGVCGNVALLVVLLKRKK